MVGTGNNGDPCTTNGDCNSGFCLPDPFPGGYCSTDCTTMSCAAGEACTTVGGVTGCLKQCSSPTDCRSGYNCYQGVCQPPCSGDSACGKGFSCQNGQCTPLPGKMTGASCTSDGECSSRTCDPNTKTCQLSCSTDGECGPGNTCWVNPIDKNGDTFTDGIEPICTKRRGGAAVGSPCKTDAGCDSGQCELGVCVILCNGTGSCPQASPMSCADMFAQIDDPALPPIKACIRKTGTLNYNLGSGGGGPVGFPSTTQGFNIWVESKGDDTNYFAGLIELDDPTQRALYITPKTPTDFVNLPIRYQPTEGATMMLVSNAPNRYTVVGGIYNFSTFAESQGGQQTDFTTLVRIKLGDAFPTSGSIPLHVFVANLGGSCIDFDATGAHNVLGAFETRLAQLFAQVNLTVGPIVYMDSPNSPSTIAVNSGGPSPQLDSLLAGATVGDASDVLEMTIIKRIDSSNMNFEVLGIAGGIPGATGIPGTVHSGVTVSMSTLCSDKSQGTFALTAAHELGHSLGLFHSLEQDNNTSDPLTDTKQNPQSNLMFWEEGAGVSLTPQQGHVILSNPAVN
jgi:hypothetical protein